jgi:hypothetical protein
MENSLDLVPVDICLFAVGRFYLARVKEPALSLSSENGFTMLFTSPRGLACRGYRGYGGCCSPKLSLSLYPLQPVVILFSLARN